MDFDQKITIKHLVAKNKLGEEIKQGAIVFVLSGLHQVLYGVILGKKM